MGMKEYIVQAYSQETIDSFDAHNAPELVRCKDCKHGHMCINGKREPMVKCELMLDEWLHDCDWFCADGERR